MEFEYWIKQEDKWVRVSYEEYREFGGDKRRAPSTWRISLLQSMLGKYRYMED